MIIIKIIKFHSIIYAKKIKKFIGLSLKFSIKFILKKTPGFVKSKFYPVISNPLKNKIYSIMGRKEKNSFEAYELLINEKYGEVEEDLQIEYLKNDFNI